MKKFKFTITGELSGFDNPEEVEEFVYDFIGTVLLGDTDRLDLTATTSTYTIVGEIGGFRNEEEVEDYIYEYIHSALVGSTDNFNLVAEELKETKQ